MGRYGSRAPKAAGNMPDSAYAARLRRIQAERISGPDGSAPPVELRNVDRLQAILSDAPVGSVTDQAAIDSGRADIIRDLALGTPEQQQLLNQVFQSLPIETQSALVREIHGRFPGKGADGWSMDSDRIFSVLGGNSEEGIARTAADIEGGTVRAGNVAEADPDSPQYISGRHISRDETLENAPSRYEGDPDAVETTIGDSEGLMRPDDARVLDPDEYDHPARGTGERDELIARGVKPSLYDEPATRPGTRVVETDPDGYPIIKQTGKGAMGPATAGYVQKGRAYESAMQARANFVHQELLRAGGSPEGAQSIWAAAMEGDERSEKILRTAHAKAYERYPATKPDNRTFNGITQETVSPKDQFQDLFRSQLADPSNERDYLDEMWQLMQDVGPGYREYLKANPDARKTGMGTRMGPKGTFSSPEEMAEAIIKLVDPGLLDRNPVTPSQRRDAMEIIGGLDPNTATKGQARALIDSERPDIPTVESDRETDSVFGYREQVKQKLTQDLIRRYGGSNWGTGQVDEAPGYISEWPNQERSVGTSTSRGDTGTEGSVKPTLPPRGLKDDAPLVADPSMVGDPETPWLDGMAMPEDFSPEEYLRILERRKKPKSWMIPDEGSSGKKAQGDPNDGPRSFEATRRNPDPHSEGPYRAAYDKSIERRADEVTAYSEHSPETFSDIIDEDGNVLRSSEILRRLDEIEAELSGLSTAGARATDPQSIQANTLMAEKERLEAALKQSMRADSMAGVVSDAKPKSVIPPKRPPQTQVGTPDPPAVSVDTTPKPGEMSNPAIVRAQKERDALIQQAREETDRATQNALMKEAAAKQKEIDRLKKEAAAAPQAQAQPAAPAPEKAETRPDGSPEYDPSEAPEEDVYVPTDAELNGATAAPPGGQSPDQLAAAAWNAADASTRRQMLQSKKGTTRRKWQQLTPQEQDLIVRQFATESPATAPQTQAAPASPPPRDPPPPPSDPPAPPSDPPVDADTAPDTAPDTTVTSPTPDDVIDPLESASATPIDATPSRPGSPNPSAVPGTPEWYQQAARQGWEDPELIAQIFPDNKDLALRSWDSLSPGEKKAWVREYRKWHTNKTKAEDAEARKAQKEAEKKAKEDAAKPTEQQAADNADAQKAPEDAESAAADAASKDPVVQPDKSEPPPKGPGLGRRAVGAAVGAATWPARTAWKLRWPLIAGGGVASWLLSEGDTGTSVDTATGAAAGSASSTGAGEESMPSPGGIPVGPGGEGGNVWDQEGFYSDAISPHDRIRLMQQQMQSRYRTPQTFENWRGNK